MTILINGKPVTDEEYKEYCKQERKKRIMNVINAQTTIKWFVYDSKVFEDITLVEEWASENYYEYDETEIIEINKEDIIKYAYDDDDIITVEQWENEHQPHIEYDDYAYEAHLATMIVREHFGLL